MATKQTTWDDVVAEIEISTIVDWHRFTDDGGIELHFVEGEGSVTYHDPADALERIQAEQAFEDGPRDEAHEEWGAMPS